VDLILVHTAPTTFSPSYAGSAAFGFGDFMNTGTTLLFLAGSGPNTGIDFEVPIVDDDLVELTETFSLQATIVGGVTAEFAQDSDTAQIEIIDNDGEAL
jgi:hypothetical protein